MKHLCLEKTSIELFHWIKNTLDTRKKCAFGDYICWLSENKIVGHSPLKNLIDVGLINDNDITEEIFLGPSALWLPSYKTRYFLKQIGLQDKCIDRYIETYILNYKYPSDNGFKQYAVLEQTLAGEQVGEHLLIPINWKPDDTLIKKIEATGIDSTEINWLISEFILYNRTIKRYLRCWTTAFLAFVRHKHPMLSDLE
ncbi:MAG: hypothetical protein KTR20_00875 [Cellvibrionaceae bacterium]|nr:hypothetical protein [Cellvibrionaceae bacterium]